jgi:hypothetical protein
MRRTGMMLVGVALGVGSCKSDVQRSIDLVPDEATALVGADVGALRQSPLGRTLPIEVIDGELRSACGLGLDVWRSIVLGCDPERYMSTFVFVVSVEGIGTKAKLECVRALATRTLGTDPWTPRDVDGRVELAIEVAGQTATGHVVDGNRVVIASTQQDDAIRALIAGEGKPAATHGLKDVLDHVDTGRALWVAAKVPPDLPAGAPGAGASSLVASVSFPGDVVLRASAAYADAELADERAAALQRQVDDFAVGLPPKLLRRVDVTTDDARLELFVRIDPDVLTKTFTDLAGTPIR